MSLIPKQIQKDQKDRIQECISILSQIKEDPLIRIHSKNPSMILLRKRMATYWREGKLMEDRIPIEGSSHSFVYRFPRRADQFVELVLRADPVYHKSLPPHLKEELYCDNDNE